MGNDGGSIPDRRDLVRTKAKSEQADKANQSRARWSFCALSKKPLQEPIVACELGKLYNKQELISYLLDKKGSNFGDGENICGHIRSLKDVKDLVLTKNPAAASAAINTDVDMATEGAQFVCPLTQKEMNGVMPFVYINTCGCTFSLAGLRALTMAPIPVDNISDAPDVTTSGVQFHICPQCGTKYEQNSDVRPIHPTSEDEYHLRNEMLARRAAEPPKVKKAKKRKVADDAETPETVKKKAPTIPSTNPSVAAASRAVTSSLVEEEQKRKAGMSAAVKSLYGDGTKRKETFMTMGTFTRYA